MKSYKVKLFREIAVIKEASGRKNTVFTKSDYIKTLKQKVDVKGLSRSEIDVEFTMPGDESC